jgi:hypothetical protein
MQGAEGAVLMPRYRIEIDVEMAADIFEWGLYPFHAVLADSSKWKRFAITLLPESDDS